MLPYQTTLSPSCEAHLTFTKERSSQGSWKFSQLVRLLTRTGGGSSVCCGLWAAGLEEVTLCSWASLPSPWSGCHRLGSPHRAVVTPLHLRSLQPSTSPAPWSSWASLWSSRWSCYSTTTTTPMVARCPSGWVPPQQLRQKRDQGAFPRGGSEDDIYF